MKSSGNYIKLSVRAIVETYDDEAASRAPAKRMPFDREGRSRSGVPYVTTWIFPFAGKSGAAQALLAAQAKRTALRGKHPEILPEAFQLATFKPSSLRGVPVIGTPARGAPEELAVAS